VSKLSYGIVNLKPIVPGHVLVIPKRVVKRFQELSPEEVGDLWQSAQHIGKLIVLLLLFGQGVFNFPRCKTGTILSSPSHDFLYSGIACSKLLYSNQLL